MGETGFHVKCALALMAALEYHYRHRTDVYVGGNLFVYYNPNDPADVVCPDVFIAFGVRSGERRTWKVWEEGKGPDVVFELTSKGTRREDRYTKPAIYEELRVSEYFLFDPEGDYLQPRLQGFRLTAGGYQPLSGARLTSEQLKLELFVEGNFVRLYDPAKSTTLPMLTEYADLAQNAQERALQEAEARRAAEAEVARLRAELARLRGEQE
jgi:Uma2 family endonuclease